MGVMEMDETAPPLLHLSAQAEDGAWVEFPPHPNRKDGKPGLSSFLMEGAFRLDDESDGIALFPELQD